MMIDTLSADDEEYEELLSTQALLVRVSDAAIISRALHIPVKPWELEEWPLDEKLAALALAQRWIQW